MWTVGPRGFRETEFNCGGAGRRKFTNLAPRATDNKKMPSKKRNPRGLRPGFEIAMGLAGGQSPARPDGPRILAGLKSPASPYGARRHIDQLSHRSRKRQTSSRFQALEMARGRREGLAMWLRHALGPQYHHLLCVRLRSCMAGGRLDLKPPKKINVGYAIPHIWPDA
jgi:hypothetical protein